MSRDRSFMLTYVGSSVLALSLYYWWNYGVIELLPEAKLITYFLAVLTVQLVAMVFAWFRLLVHI